MKKAILSTILAASFILAAATVVCANDVMPMAAPENCISGNSSGHGFTEAWEASTSEGDAHLTYGFNTMFVDEDYAWADHATEMHWASIKNGNEEWHTPILPSLAGFTSKVEVEHAGTRVYYACEW